MGERCVYIKVTITDRPSNGGGTDMDLTARVMLCDEFNAKYVTFLSNDESVTATPPFNHHPNVFQVLMHASWDRSHLPSIIYLLCVHLYNYNYVFVLA